MPRVKHLALPLAGLALLPGCFILFHDPEGGGGQSAGGTGGTISTSSSSSATAAQSSGSGSGSVSVGTGGNVGTAVQFDGATGIIGFPSTGAFTPTSGFTWELWFLADVIPNKSMIGLGATLFGVMDGAPCEDIYLGFGSEVSPQNELTFLVDGSGGCNFRDPDPVRFLPMGGFSSGWHHVAAVAEYQGTKQIQLYFDGSLVAAKDWTRTPVNRPTMAVTAGQWSDSVSSAAAFKGRIDELRIYGVALPQPAIADHYAMGAGTFGLGSDPNIVAGWHFDEGMGDMVLPFAGSGQGTMKLGVTWVPGIVMHP